MVKVMLFVRRLALTALLLAVPLAQADLSNCTGVYVGRIWVEQGSGALKAVVLLNNPTDYGGSYWVSFANWTTDEQKSALATLTAAKLAGHRVDVTTTDVSTCNILNGFMQMKGVFLSTNP